MKVKSEIVENIPLYSTKEYTQFKVLEGSREVQDRHVSALAKKLSNKNLMKEFPVIVNEKMEVIDGWHRIKACEILGFPVYYQVKPHLNSDDMTQINTGMRNWTWKDFAESFATRGNTNYKEFLQLFEDYGNTRFNVGLIYCGVRDTRAKLAKDGSLSLTPRRIFTDGNLEVKNYKLAQKLLGQLDDIVEASQVNSRELAIALYSFMRTPDYDHVRMVDHVRQYGSVLKTCYSTTDFLYELDKIYKTHR